MKNTNLILAIVCLQLVACTPEKITNESHQSNMKATVAYLADDKLEGRAIGTQGEQLAADYIAKQFKEIGLLPKGTTGFIQEFTVTPSSNPHEKAKVGGDKSDTVTQIIGKNIVGFIDNKSENTIVLGAHYDHLGFGGVASLHRGVEGDSIHNGADDNASGVALIIELARILNQKEAQKNNYLFIAFSGEENGLWGSNYFSKNPTVEIGAINYMLNFDMVGRLNEEQSVAVHGTGTSPIWKDAVPNANADSLNLVMKESGVGPSDHTSFYLKDLPVLHFFTGQHEDYHKPSDDADKINYKGMVTVLSYVDRLIENVNTAGKIEFTKTKDDSKDTPRFKVTLGVVPDYLFNGPGMRIDGVSLEKTAAEAGIVKGDIVLKMGDIEILDMMGYMKALSEFEKGDSTIVVIKRDNKEMKLPVVFL